MDICFWSGICLDRIKIQQSEFITPELISEISRRGIKSFIMILSWCLICKICTFQFHCILNKAHAISVNHQRLGVDFYSPGNLADVLVVNCIFVNFRIFFKFIFGHLKIFSIRKCVFPFTRYSWPSLELSRNSSQPWQLVIQLSARFATIIQMKWKFATHKWIKLMMICWDLLVSIYVVDSAVSLITYSYVCFSSSLAS